MNGFMNLCRGTIFLMKLCVTEDICTNLGRKLPGILSTYLPKVTFNTKKSAHFL